MSWPLSQDFNEAVQNPGTAFADPDLKAGTPAAGPTGVPLPRSGNYADVYMLAGADTRRWAVKCFTRPVAPDLAERYAAVADHLARSNLPFAVGFDYLPSGVRVRGKYYPIVKMPWVDGFPINQFVREQMNRASVLEAMLSLWVRLCRRLRETGMAHCDLQHGNVLLVPSGGKANALELKLVDYDGTFVPALAGRPTGEAGHAAYQHPERVLTNAYSADLDRFPHLVVATALRGLLVGGQPLWQKYDNGDNLLFTGDDFKAPGKSKLMRELWDTGDPFTVGLLAHLVNSCGKPLAQTPWLDQLMPEGRPPGLTPSQERQAAQALGVPVAVPAGWEPPVQPGVNTPGSPPLAFDAGRPKRAKSGSPVVAVTVVGGLLVIGSLVGGAMVVMSGKTPKPDDPPAATAEKPPEPVKPPEIVPPPGGVTPTPDPVKPPVAVKPPTPQPGANTPGSPKPVFAAKELWSVPATATVAPAAVAVAPDGSRLFVAGKGSNAVAAFDAKDGRRLGLFREAQGAVVFAPLPKGKVAVATGNEPFIFVWNPDGGRPERFPIPEPAPAYTRLEVSPGGKYAMLVAPGKVQVLDFDDPGKVVMASPATDPPTGLLADTTGTWALTTDADGKTVRVTPVGRPGKEGALSPKVGPVLAQAWHAPTHLVALRRLPGQKEVGAEVRVWTTEAPFNEVKNLPGPFALAAPKFTPDGRRLLLAAGSTVEAYDTATWEKVATATAKAEVIDFTVAGNTVAVVSADKTLRLFDLGAAAEPSAVTPAVAAKPELKQTWRVPVDTDLSLQPRVLRFSLDGSKLVAPEQKAPTVFVLDAATGLRKLLVTEPGGSVAAFPVNGGKVFAYPADAPAARVWDDAAALAGPALKVPHDGKATLLAVAPSGRFAVVRRGAETALLDTGTGKTTQLAATAATVVLAPEGDRAFVAEGAKARLVTVPDARVLIAFDLPFPRARSAAVAPGAALAAVLGPPDAAGEGTLHVFDLTTGKSAKAVTGRFTGATLRFPAGGRYVAAVGPHPADGSRVELWDWKAGTIAFWTPDAVAAGTFDVSPDGRRLAVLGADRYVHAYDLPAAPAAAGATVAAPTLPVTPSAPARKPLPDAAAAKKKEDELRGIYKAEYAKKAAADKQKFADQLAREAGQTADPTTKYVMVREAGRLAAEAFDVAGAVKAADALAADFATDAAAEKADVLDKLLAAATRIPHLRAVAEAADDAADEAAAADQFDPAARLAALAAAAYTKAALPAQAKEAEAHAAHLKELKELFGPVKAALETLKANPADAAAALAVGRYRCLVQQRWEDGLPFLAAGSDPTLKAAAALDLKAATDADTTDTQRGAAWEAAAAARPEADRPPVLGRAKFWYAKALTSIKDGPDLRVAQTKLAFTAGGTEFRPGLVAEYYSGPNAVGLRKKRGQVDYAVEAKDFPAGALVRVVWQGVLVPPAAGSYRLVAETPDAVQVKVFAKPDQRTVIDAKAGAAKAETVVKLPAKPVLIEVAYLAELGKGRPGSHSFALKWERPGGKGVEPIPPEALFHAKKLEELVGEK